MSEIHAQDKQEKQSDNKTLKLVKDDGGGYGPDFNIGLLKKIAELESRIEVKDDGGGYGPDFNIGLLKKIAELESRIEVLSKAIQDAERILGTVPSTMHEKRDVFFNAKLTEHTTITAGHTVIFNKVEENVGDGYNGLTGIFRAPWSGTYQLSLSILSREKGKYAHTELVKNGKEIGRVFAGSDTAVWAQMGAVTVTTKLEQGDEVYARQMLGMTGNLHGDFYCSFSGVKI